MISKTVHNHVASSACTMANQNELLLSTDFSGLGSPEEALKRLGVPHRVVFACERDKYARNSYYANHEPEIFYDDVTTRDNKTAPYSDMYVFGFPCQAFSIAGKQKGFEDTRGTLFFNSLDYINQKRPRTFIAENVKGLLSHDNGKTFRTIIDCLAVSENGQQNLYPKLDCVGYHVFYAVHNTKNYGIPQNRERIFIIAFRDEADALNFRQPKGFPLLLKLKDMLQDALSEKYQLYRTIQQVGSIMRYYDVPEKYYLSDKMLAGLVKHTENSKEKGRGFEFKPSDGEGNAKCIRANNFKMGPDDNYIKVNEATKQGYAIAEPGDSINLSVPTSTTSTTRRGRVGKGQANTLDTQCNQAVVVNERIAGWFENENVIGAYQGDVKRSSVSEHIYHKPEGVCNTIQTAHVPKLITGIRIRRLTPRECFRLQGYSDSFFDKCAAVNSDTQLYKQAGNSITVDTILNVMKSVLVCIGYKF